MSIRSKSQLNNSYSLISQRVKQLSPSGIRKFFDLLASMDGVISLGVGEPDYATPWHISEAAVQSLEKGYTMYTSNSGMPELREETAKYLKYISRTHKEDFVGECEVGHVTMILSTG